MAIRKQRTSGLVQKLIASDTHFQNETKKKIEESDSEILNNQKPNVLYDPDDLIEGGDTHFVEASKSKKKSKRVKAENVSTLDNDQDMSQFFRKSDDELEGPNAKSNTLQGEDDLEESDGMGEEELGLDEPDEDSEVHAEDLEEDEEEWDPDPVLDQDEEEEIDEDGDSEEEDEDSNPDDADSDTMDILDVDETPEDEINGMLFASIGNKVMVIKGTRIIAHMGRKQAVQAKVEDIYASTEFQDAVAEECRRHGIRAGLQSMGFVLASVDITKSTVVNARVDEKVKAVTSAIRHSYKERGNCMNQCLAIASVGINRKYFKGAENLLADNLVAGLQSAGVRNAKQVVNAAFAQDGIAYAKAIVTLAEKLAAMPEQTRNQFAEALDMVDDEGEFVESDVEDTEVDDADFIDADDDADFDEASDDDFVPATVTAALSKPGKKTPALLKAGVSVTAHSILASDEPLIF